MDCSICCATIQGRYVEFHPNEHSKSRHLFHIRCALEHFDKQTDPNCPLCRGVIGKITVWEGANSQCYTPDEFMQQSKNALDFWLPAEHKKLPISSPRYFLQFSERADLSSADLLEAISRTVHLHVRDEVKQKMIDNFLARHPDVNIPISFFVYAIKYNSIELAKRCSCDKSEPFSLLALHDLPLKRISDEIANLLGDLIKELNPEEHFKDFTYLFSLFLFNEKYETLIEMLDKYKENEYFIKWVSKEIFSDVYNFSKNEGFIKKFKETLSDSTKNDCINFSDAMMDGWNSWWRNDEKIAPKWEHLEPCLNFLASIMTADKLYLFLKNCNIGPNRDSFYTNHKHPKAILNTKIEKWLAEISMWPF